MRGLSVRSSICMVSFDEFCRAYEQFRYPPNTEQLETIVPALSEALFIVAGPGTGKTTCLTLRILKLMLVDGVAPNGILATTFTKKAAAELRSRILSWGFQLLERLQADPEISEETKTWLAKVDINQVMTGTIDSLCERILRDYRVPGSQPPILADDFVSKTLLLREGLLKDERYLNGDLNQFLLEIQGSKYGWNVGKKVNLLQQIWDRRFQDQVEWPTFLASGTRVSDELDEQKALDILRDAIADYETALGDRLMVDFARLEQAVLERLQQGTLAEFSDQLQVVLVDEYQDSNLMQEQIYFELAKACGGALTVVGDDDQSLYRFRGATVELFSEFATRYETVFSRQPKTVFLKTNYRSTQQIVAFVNNYATLDRAFQGVRVRNKPRLLHGPSAEEGVPVLGMFRPDVETLARDLAAFLRQVFRGSGFTLPSGTQLEANSDGGDLGDCALLCSSPAEYNGSGKARLPFLLRHQLMLGSPRMEVFNPRGQELTDIRVVMVFGGLLLECLDPGGAIEEETSGLNQDIQTTFSVWREAALEFFEALAPLGPAYPLKDFATGWASRQPRKSHLRWPASGVHPSLARLSMRKRR